jgi:hypothetical protein
MVKGTENHDQSHYFCLGLTEQCPMMPVTAQMTANVSRKKFTEQVSPVSFYRREVHSLR